MKKILNLLFILLISINVFGLTTDTIFINRTGTTVQKDSARFYRIVTKVDTNQYKIEDFYLTGQLQMVAYNSSPVEVVKKGKYIFYDSLGFISSEGEYHLGNRIGEWKQYYFGTTNIKSIRNYKENQKGHCLKIFDSITHNLKLEGEYNNNSFKTGKFIEYYSKDNKILSITNYLNNFREGEAIEYYNTGETKRKEVYVNGKLKKGELFDRNGEKQKYYPYYKKAELGESILKCLNNNIKGFDKNYKHINLIVKYTITKFGNIINVQIIENDFPEINQQIVNAISKINHNKPSLKENVPVDTDITHKINKYNSFEY